MNSVINYLLLITAFSLFSQLLAAQSFDIKTGGHCYTLEIPDYLTKTYKLNDVASLQYMNATKEAYVIVIEDSKEHLAELGTKFIDAEDFLRFFIKDYQVESRNRKVGKLENFESNNYGHSQVEMTWDSEDASLYMLITSVETPDHFYKILCWTLDEFKDDYKADYQKIARSLQE